MIRRRDEELIQAAFDRQMSETEFEQFEARLHDEPDLRALYYEYSNLHHALIEEYDGSSVLPPRRRALRSFSPVRSGIVQSLLSAAAILVALLTVAWFIGVRPSIPRARVVFGPETHGQVINPEGGRDASGLVPGSQLVLSHGSAELTMASGVRGIIEGPARLECLGKNEVRLERGRAWFHVPEGAEGFTCLTDTLDIEDLGTAFGVVAKPAAPEELHVLEGRVRIHPIGRTHETRDLHAGEGVSWNGRSFGILPRTPRFATSLPRRVQVFYDDFSEADETRLDGKLPDHGAGPWTVSLGDPAIFGQLLDTSGAAKKAFAAIDSHLDELNHVLLVTIHTKQPDSRLFHSDGWAGVSLFTGEQEHIFVGDPFGPESGWAIQPLGGQAVSPTPPLHGKRTVTLRYDFHDGLAELFEGADTHGEALASEWIAPGLAFDRIRIANDEGGDIAIDYLRVSVLVATPDAR